MFTGRVLIVRFVFAEGSRRVVKVGGITGRGNSVGVVIEEAAGLGPDHRSSAGLAWPAECPPHMSDMFFRFGRGRCRRRQQ